MPFARAFIVDEVERERKELRRGEVEGRICKMLQARRLKEMTEQLAQSQRRQAELNDQVHGVKRWCVEQRGMVR